MAAERRASLTHTPTRRSLVEDLVARPTPMAETPASVSPTHPSEEDASSGAAGAGTTQPTSAPTTAPSSDDASASSTETPTQEQQRVGPGRPRNQRVMRPFTTTIEIGLRARIDDYCHQHNATRVDVLDQALREALDAWEGEHQGQPGEPDCPGRT